MKIALLGKGKTGGIVLDELIKRQIEHTVFDSKNLPDLNKLAPYDVVISFLPGEAFSHYIPLLISAQKNVVSGSTGVPLPHDLNDRLISAQLSWIHGNNFSLGMSVVKEMIESMKKAKKFYEHVQFKLHDIHHTKKLDSPSGTALSMKEWLSEDVEITSERIGDVVGIHELSMITTNEEIHLKHVALNRKLFADGALFAATEISACQIGLHSFQNIVAKYL